MDTNKVKLLLLDADQASARKIVSLLNDGPEHRFAITTIHDFEKGLEKIQGGDYHAVLSDLDFPDCKGDDTLNKLCGPDIKVPVVIFTSPKYEVSSPVAIQKGIQDFHIKGSVTGKTLRNSIHYAIERKKREVNQFIRHKKLARDNKNLVKTILHDPLTELPNKQGLQRESQSKNLWQHLEQNDLVSMLVNIENFKLINESFGHTEGDTVLKRVADIIKEAVRPQDIVSRIGGVEFMVFLPETPQGDGLRMAEKVRNALAESSIKVKGHAAKVITRIAVIKVTSETDSVNKVLAKAQSILTVHKQDRGNKIFFEPPGRRSQSSNNELEQILSALRREDSFQPVKQAIYRLEDQSIIGYEFFIRSNIKIFENPNDFFRLCVGARILPLVDRQCLKACIQSARKLATPTKIHLNLFPITLLDLSIDKILDLFPDEETLENFCIELSIQQIIGDPSDLIRAVKRIKEFGIKIAIDDVGFGNSTIESQIMLEPDIIKIDPKSVSGIGRNWQMKEQLQRLNDMLKGLDVEIHCEGIETLEDLYILKKMGIQYGQGYLWGKPE